MIKVETDEDFQVPKDHPRAESIRIRERLIEGFKEGFVAVAGLIAHGRGEAFDYILGEKTHKFAEIAEEAAVAALLLAKNPVISVNGNTAALVPHEIVQLSKLLNAKLEVNLFYRTREREEAIKKVLEAAGAEKVLGVGESASATIPELSHSRRKVDPEGILIADAVMIPLEDGDRTIALRKLGKQVIAIDLNPLSRTAQEANITIVNNITRTIPEMIQITQNIINTKKKREELQKILKTYNNKDILSMATKTINEYLTKHAKGCD